MTGVSRLPAFGGRHSESACYLRPTSLPYGNTTSLPSNVTASWDDAGRTRNTNTPNGATAGVPGFNEYGYVGGLRVWKKITRNGSTFEHRVYVHAGPNLIAEYNAGAAASSPAQEYVYADQIDSLVMIHRSNNQKLGVTRNRQWSVVGLHDLANGNVVERYAYDMTGKRTIYAANGTTVRSTSSFGNHFGYTNRWHDAESGLMYFRARYYNPLTGEFLRRDPAGFVDGMSLYRGYMDVNYVDPSGLQTVRCRCYSGWLDGDVFGSTTDVQVECNRVLDDCCRKACSKLGGWTGTYQAQNTQEFSNLKYEDYLFSYESKQPHDPVDLWLTRAKLGSFGIAGVSLGGAGITYGVSTFGWYGLGAIVLKEAGEAAKDAVLEGTIGFSPPTGIRGAVKGIGDFFKKLFKKPPKLTPPPSMSNHDFVQELANRAEAWGRRKGLNPTGNVEGTKKHKYAEELLKRFQKMFNSRLDLSPEVRYKNGTPYKKGDGVKDSVRLDVVEGPVDNPTAVFDYKFGDAVLDADREAQMRKVAGLSPSCPVNPIKPELPPL